MKAVRVFYAAFAAPKPGFHNRHMRITILCVGKIKEKFYRDALTEYVKRLGRYTKCEILEVEDEKTPEEASPKEEKQIKEKEGARLISRMKDDMYVIALAIDGKAYSSEELAEEIRRLTLHGKSHLAFVIGGSLGLSEEVLSRAEAKISFSAMTFPHQLMRVILAEQLYRSFRIIHGEPYHK